MDKLINKLMDTGRAMTFTINPDDRDCLVTIYKPHSADEEKEFYGKSLEKTIEQAANFLGLTIQ